MDFRITPLLLIALAGCRTECRSVNDGLIPTTPEDPPLVCPLALPADPYAEARASCTFSAGATPEETLGVPAALAAQLPIRHVIVVMRENRTFDHLFGTAPADFTNLDVAGKPVAPFHAKSTCIKSNALHQWDAMHAGVNGGAMDGFVKNAAQLNFTDGHFAMSFYDSSDLPFEHWLARTWASNDRHFASVRSGTNPNRAFLYLGTNDGVRQSEEGFPKRSTPSLFSALEAAGLSWGVYSDDQLLSGSMGWSINDRGCHCERDLITQLDTGTLPNVVFVDSTVEVDDDHPPADLQRGEAWVRNLYQHVIASPQWQRTALIWTYDEGGGFADHVPPPKRACVARPGTVDDAYFELGPRVPFVIVSPWKPGFVSHTPQEHTAITRFIETLFGLPALTARDANSPALLEAFDFSCNPPLLKPPTAEKIASRRADPSARVRGDATTGPRAAGDGDGQWLRDARCAHPSRSAIDLRREPGADARRAGAHQPRALALPRHAVVPRRGEPHHAADAQRLSGPRCGGERHRLDDSQAQPRWLVLGDAHHHLRTPAR